MIFRPLMQGNLYIFCLSPGSISPLPYYCLTKLLMLVTRLQTDRLWSSAYARVWEIINLRFQNFWLTLTVKWFDLKLQSNGIYSGLKGTQAAITFTISSDAPLESQNHERFFIFSMLFQNAEYNNKWACIIISIPPNGPKGFRNFIQLNQQLDNFALFISNSPFNE